MTGRQTHSTTYHPYIHRYRKARISESEEPNRKKKRRSQSTKSRQRSLSPLSKRMAMLGESDARTHNSQFNHPYGYQPPPPEELAHAPHAPARSQADIDYELKVTALSLSLLFTSGRLAVDIRT